MAGNTNTSMPDSLMRMKKIFYEHGADAKITFKDGEEIKVNKGLLGTQSAFFHEVFFGKSPKNELYVSDFDSVTFKLFLDCLMGFKPYADLDSLLIFPIAHKYRSEESLEKCIEALKPKVMNEAVCHTLNLALFYENQDLIDSVFKFLKEKCSVVALLETEEYCSHVLEPIALAKLLHDIEMDFYLVQLICKWGENYLKLSNKTINLGLFLSQHKILDKMSELRFESEKSTFEFIKFNETNKVFTAEHMLGIWQNNISTDYLRKLPNDGSWVFIMKGETLTEDLIFLKPIIFTDVTESDLLKIEVWRNEIIFMDSVSQSKYPVTCNINLDNYCSESRKSNLDLLKHYDFSFKGTNAIKKGKKAIYEIKLNPVPSYFFCLKSVHISYTFDCNCRILKTSLDPAMFGNSKLSMYHTFDLTSELAKKIRPFVWNSLSEELKSHMDPCAVPKPISSTSGSFLKLYSLPRFVCPLGELRLKLSEKRKI